MISLLLEANDDENEAEILGSKLRMSCTQVLDEIRQFEECMAENSSDLDGKIELSYFKSELNTELNRLNKLAKQDPTFRTNINYLRASNHVFDEAIWSIAKTCRGVIAIKKSNIKKHRQTKHDCNTNINRQADSHTRTDIIAQNGAEWVKVCMVTTKRMLWDLTKLGYAGFQGEESDDDSEPEQDNGPSTASELLDLVLVKQIMELIEISRSKVEFRCPTIRLVLPRIEERQAPAYIANVLKTIRNLGVIVQTKDDLPASLAFTKEIALQMAPNRFVTFSNTLNMDCTLLISFCSDISHGGVEKQDWHSSATRTHIECELEEPLLADKIWRALSDHPLVCTRQAYEKLKEVVEIIGTTAEKRRAILLFEPDSPNMSPEQRMKELQDLSTYNVPSSWKLPIAISDEDHAAVLKISLPATFFEKIEEDVKEMSSTTWSTLCYGWNARITTLSSNREALNKIRRSIAKHRGDDDTIIGPDVWTFSPARNLVGDFYVRDRSLVPDSWNSKPKPK